jgi:hypothetical protein
MAIREQRVSARSARSLGLARAWHGATAITAIVALSIQFVVALFPNNSANSTWSPADVATRLLQFFSYFTTQSNLIVAVVCVVLVLRPHHDSLPWRVGRSAGLYAISVTFVVYGALLAPTFSFRGATGVANVGVHYLVPFLTVVGWFIFGPRGRIDLRSLAWSAIWPLGYMTYTLVHGRLSGWYPYPFINVNRLGLEIAVRNGAAIICFMVVIGGIFLIVDRVRTPRRAPTLPLN